MPKSRDLNINDDPFSLIQDNRRPRLESETGWARVGVTAGYEASTNRAYYPGVGFENSWANADVSQAPASWYMSHGGEVRLRGKITGGSVNTVAFTLPEEVRPEYAETFVCPVDENGNIDLSGIKFRAFGEGDL